MAKRFRGNSVFVYVVEHIEKHPYPSFTTREISYFCISKTDQLMKKETINVRVNLNECEIIPKEDIHKKRKRHTIRHFSFVDEREIKQTAARDLWDRTTYTKK